MDYKTTVAAIAQHTQAAENALPLRNAACGSKFWFQPQPARRVCLFFHGFTAAPYQFAPLAEALYKIGCTVLVPLMPGHGQAGQWGQNNPPPLPEDPEVYQKFALEWFQKAQALGQEVIVGGLSGGGTLATWLAFEKAAEIDRALLFAPYYTSSSRVIDLFVKTTNSYFQWQSDPKAVKKVAIGYEGFVMPNLRVFLTMGHDLLQRSKTDPVAPMFIISSESDRAVDNQDHEILFRRTLKRQPKNWYYRFDRVLDIPHTMMTQQEGNGYQSLLITMAKAYIESNLTWAEVEEIGYRMTQGKTFNAVIAELQLSQPLSTSMPAMMTMIDKRSIAMARQPKRSSRG